jgi:tetratricopeptide (TPR) repeat protein
MATTIRADLLWDYVVRVERPDRESGEPRTVGSGFFVAPGWVLTCAHVVEDAQSVTVRRARGSVPLSGRVMARSDPRPAGDGDRPLWPFPDLALIQLTGQDLPPHPCALLDPVPPPLGAECFASGFTRRGAEREPEGTGFSFTVEAHEVDGYCRLKAGQAAPGLSGAPLLCPTTRTVVGVVCATRDAESALGGWASPVSTLFGDAHAVGIPDALRELGTYVGRLNRAAVVADRKSWADLLPVDDMGGVVSRPWAEFTYSDGSSPADLLRADFGVVPYLFRDREVQQAISWCDDPARVSVARVVGDGGSGKTRFAIELCRRMEDRGWTAGFWPRDSKAAEIVPWPRNIRPMPLPQLLVVEYAEASDLGVLQAGLEIAQAAATDVAPVRIMLLTRSHIGGLSDPLDALQELAPAALKNVLHARVGNAAAERLLTLGQRGELFQAAYERFTAVWPTGSRVLDDGFAPPAPDLSDERYALPLEVLFEAHHRALSEHGLEEGGAAASARPGRARRPEDSVLDHERRFWERTRPAQPGLGKGWTDACVALATLVGAADQDEADALLRLLPGLDTPAARDEVATWLAELYDGPLYLNPLRPDRLGEALVADVLRQNPRTGRDLLAGALGLDSDDRIFQTLTVLARVTAGDADDHAMARLAADALALTLSGLVRRADPGSQESGGGTGRTLATALSRLVTGSVGDLLVTSADHGESATRNALGTNLLKLGSLVRDSGRIEEARDLYHRAQAVFESLCEQAPEDPGARYGLGAARTRLGTLARYTGRIATAREQFTSALDVYRQVVKLAPDNPAYQHALGIDYQRLGEVAWRSARGGEARHLFSVSHRIFERLCSGNPDSPEYRHALGISHAKFAMMARVEKELGTARTRYVQALTIQEALVAGYPDNRDFQHALALTRQQLGVVDMKLGRTGEARALFLASRDALDQLTAADPLNPGYRVSLAAGQRNLGDLALDDNRIAEADGLFRDAIVLTERLAQQSPDNPSFRYWLGIYFQRLGRVAGKVGDAERARESYALALEIHDRLSLDEPGTASYRYALGFDHRCLGDLARAEGAFGTAREHYAAAAGIYEQLHRESPERKPYRQAMGVSWARLAEVQENLPEAREPDDALYLRARAFRDRRTADDVWNEGRHDEARELYTRVIGIYEKLRAADRAHPDYPHYLKTTRVKLARLADAAGWTEHVTDDPVYLRALSVHHYHHGTKARDDGHTEAAAAHFRAWLAHGERLMEQNPGDHGFRRILGFGRLQSGQIEQRLGRTAAAREQYTLALSDYALLAEAEPGNRDHLFGLVIGHQYLGYLDRRNGRPDAARDHHTAAVAICSDLAEAHPYVLKFRFALALSQQQLASLCRNAGDREGARRNSAAATALFEGLVAFRPENSDYQRGLGAARTALAESLREDTAAESRPHRPAGRTVDPGSAREAAAQAAQLYAQGLSHQRLGNLARAAGRLDEARGHFGQAVAAFERLTTLDPANESYHRALRSSRLRQAKLPPA